MKEEAVLIIFEHILSPTGYVHDSLKRVTNTAAANWNDLPYDIRDCSSVSVFKRKLKSHLFGIAYIA